MPMAGESFDRVEVRYYSLGGTSCLTCPPHYKVVDHITVDFVGSGGTTFTKNMYPDPHVGGVWRAGFDGQLAENVLSALYFGCSFHDSQCYDEEHRVAAYLLVGYDYEQNVNPGGLQYIAEDNCSPFTSFTPAPTQHPPFNLDERILLDDQGKPWKSGCSLGIDTTFASWIQFDSTDTTETYNEGGSARVHGPFCVPDPCNPPPDKTRWWYALTRTYPYVTKVSSGETDDTGDRAPKDWLSGPYFKTYVQDTGPPNCTGHWVDVPDPDPYTPTWLVEYQDQDDSGNDIGNPYLSCYPNGTAGITCRAWDDVITCDGGTAGPPNVMPVTVETNQDLDPDRDNPEAATKRKRTYVDGPWPSARWCCPSCPECGRMSKGRKTANYDFPGLRWVGQDFGKKPGSDDNSYENREYLRCMIGENWNTPDVDKPGGGRGFSLGRKQAFRNILGAPAEVVMGDDDTGMGGEPPMSPPVLGQVNENPRHWGTRVGDPPGGSTPPGYDLPTRWWVLPSYDDDTGKLTVTETSRLGYPGVWAAGPFDSTDTTDDGRAAGHAAADAAATGDAWWCCEFQDKDAEGGNVGLPYLGCASQRNLPLPPIPSPPIEGGTPPPRWRIGISLDGADLDPDRENPADAATRTATLTDGPWVGVSGGGMQDRCKANCPPCGAITTTLSTASVSRPVPVFWYSVLRDGKLSAVKSAERPDDSVYVAGPFIRESDALALGA